VAILGAGGLGAAYGSRFHEANGVQTFLVASGVRAARLRQDGLVINGRPTHIPVATPEEANAAADLIIVALKHHHLAEALPLLRPFVGEDTIILSVLNGLDSETVIGDLYGMDKLLYTIALGIDAVREGNVIDYSAQGKLFFGEPRNELISPRVRRVQEALSRAGIPYETPVDMVRTMWRKFMINVGINQASAVLRAPYGLFQTNAEAQALMESLMHEVVLLAQAQAIDLSEQDVADWYAFLNSLSPAGKTSMLQDVEAGRQTEGVIFGGKVIELGRELGIPTPVNEIVWRILALTT
jgi:2-dehydropantoate 2-reductase